MSAVELLEKVKALPNREREKFLWAVLTLEEKPAAHPTAAGKPVKWPDVAARAKRIFGAKTQPNLILLEREEANS